ncbi:MAG: hypothetical protein HY675_18630 [Chloroflexi bacterium]|nr:hypothetical protein [Chloroflexota bacterium]
MRLELASFPVKSVRFGAHTSYEDGILNVDKAELLGLAMRDERVVAADLDVALPGERTRIANTRDAVEPRVKTSGPGCVFPGILGPVETVGEGRTNRLDGVTVIHCSRYEPAVLTGSGAGNTGIVDMWEPGALLTPLSSTVNIVLTTTLAAGISEIEAHTSIQLAECRIAQRLAETTKGQSPENLEVFELSKVNPSLPRVVYIMGCLTEWHTIHSGVAYYGLPIRESLPTLVHPNELLDGAVTSDARRGNSIQVLTWRWMNQPVIMALLREHGKRLNFIGVILQRTRFESEFGKQVTAASTSQLARLWSADAAVITRSCNSGNNLVDVMLTLQACERKGISTVFLTPEMADSDGTGPALHFYVPEATAMVSTGNLNVGPRLPAPDKVIGCAEGEMIVTKPGSKPISPWGELSFETWVEIAEGVDWFGGAYAGCADY